MFYFSYDFFSAMLFYSEGYKVNAFMNLIVSDNMQITLRQLLKVIVFTNKQ